MCILSQFSSTDVFITYVFFVDKTEMFLELHGNSLVRMQCMEYVQQVSTELIQYVEVFIA